MVHAKVAATPQSVHKKIQMEAGICAILKERNKQHRTQDPVRERGKKMLITITGMNIEVSDYLNDLVIKKVSKLDKYFPEDTEAHVTMAVERNRHIVEVTIPYTGGIIRGEETSGDMYASIDNVLAKLEKQIVRHRTKLEKSLRAGAFKTPEPVFADAFDADDEEDAPRVVRVKRFDIKPMTVEEAMLQLELLGHAFYVFTNGDSGQINVIYKRKDGNFGLIEPE